MDTTMPAELWRDQLQRWAIPDNILRAAPENPHSFSVTLFSALADEALRQPRSQTHERAVERLPDGGSVLDVGCGGGAGSLPLTPPARRLIGVDQSAGMLEVFAQGAQQRGAEVATVKGTWPDVAGTTPIADVVVCLHVIYNVADLTPFVQALTSHARERVVLEFPTRHPLAWLTPYWQRIHDVDRPLGPTAGDALAVLAAAGLDVHHERWLRTHGLRDAPLDDQVAFIRKRLAMGPERDAELKELIGQIGLPGQREVVTAWWDGRPGEGRAPASPAGGDLSRAAGV
jgi:SAM-dependent methyltransferase